MALSQPDEFDVLLALREAIENSADPNPQKAAHELAMGLPDDCLRPALVDALCALAPTLAGTNRRKVFAAAAQSAKPSQPSKPSKWHNKGAEQYQRLIAQTLKTANGWKELRDCTRDDLLFAAQYRRDHAAATIAQAETFEAIADAMAQHQVRTAGDLPPDVIREAIQ